MAAGRTKTEYVCSNCGTTSVKWLGQCPGCNQYSTMEETVVRPEVVKKGAAARASGWAGAGGAGGQTRTLANVGNSHQVARLPTGVGEFDRVLGGGLMPDGVVLLGGDPGIGKSTLLIQTLAKLSGAGKKVLYVTGEESLEQVADRGRRLNLDLSNVHALAETTLEVILETMARDKPDAVVIDSIQTVYSEQLTSAPGTVSQVRECAGQLTRFAKSQHRCSVLLVGHVTKSGEIAGPRVLEHLVDTVLYFEGDPSSPFRLIRAMKNRFGAVNELGAFEMTAEGLISVDNPSALFLSGDRQAASGSCVLVMQEGPRPMLIEIQALLDDAAGNNPRRLAVGVDTNRLAMLLAVVHKHAHLDVGTMDVFVNAVGGIKAIEPAADLAMALAMVSSLTERPLPSDLACFGEVGLTGEIRPVQNAEDRIREAMKLGFKRIIIPTRNLPKTPPKGIEILTARKLIDALGHVAEMH